MKKTRGMNNKGFSLIEVLVATAVFLLFALGIYGGIKLVFKIVYNSRLRIIETAVLSEKLETVRNLPFEDVGIKNGIPGGVLPYSTTTVRNGIDFDIITTVRNIDDPFDGMATGTAQVDNAPADYKLVEMSIICRQCAQSNPVTLSTRVSPRGLEGASDNGSLFVHVFDSQGLDVKGADVDVTYNGSTTLNIQDTTDKDGMVKIIDTPTGTQAYDITVTKDEYSSDYTISPSVENPNPTKLPANVVSQRVTNISFAIDEYASLDINTIGNNCSAIGNASFNIHGEKIIGSNPTVYKLDEDLNTDASGDYIFSSIEWDKYHLSASGTPYDISGTIPAHPFDITAGLDQDSYLILEPHTANSIWVLVRDAATKQPLSTADVRLTSTDYDKTFQTSVGFLSQTDWSGGSGQTSYTNETQYFSDNGNIENNDPAGDVKLDKLGGSYMSSGVLESSSFDFGSTTTYRNLILRPDSQPVSTSLKLQIATSNSSSLASWDFVGPDGTASSYYTNTSTLINSSHNGERYLRYKAYLDTNDTKETPTFSELIVTYTNGCTPPGQAFFNNLNSGTYSLEVSKTGYETNLDTSVNIDGNIEAIVDLSPSS